MGVTTAELGKLLEQNQVRYSEDGAPKLAAELEKTFGGSAQKAMTICSRPGHRTACRTRGLSSSRLHEQGRLCR